MREIFPGLLAVIFSIAMVFNFGALIHRSFYQSKLIQQCEEKKEFLIQDVVVRCEIIKDLR